MHMYHPPPPVPGLDTQAAQPVPADRFGSAWLRDLAGSMTAVMRCAPGVGLAAPQIGQPWRVIVLEDRQEYIDKQVGLAGPVDRADTWRAEGPS